jgi:hypothetical protein
MRWTAAGLALFGVLGMGLAACTPAPVVVAVPQPPPPAPPQPPPPPPVAPAPVASNWSFDRTACSAKASGPGLSLDVTASSAELRLVLHMARRVSLRANTDVPIAFTGRSGNWTLAGRLAVPRQLTAASPMSEDAVSRVLVLLSGGTIRISNGRSGLPPLRVPDAAQAGRSWFECVKQRLFP